MNQEDFEYSIKDSLLYKFGENSADRIENLWIMATSQELDWEHFGVTNVNKFKDYMSDLDFAQNTIRDYCSKIRSAVSDFYQLHDISIRAVKALHVEGEDNDKCVLTQEELNRLINFEYVEPGKCAIYYEVNKYNRIMMVRDLFCMSCLTGLRVSDIMNITQDNIEYQNHRYYLVYKQQKTKRVVSVPASKALLAIMDRGFYNKNYRLPNAFYNRILKVACKKAGIDAKTRIIEGSKTIIGPKWKFISSHTARRTFATLLYLNGIDIGRISMYMGHTSIQTTQKYIRMFGVEDKRSRVFLDSFQVRTI